MSRSPPLSARVPLPRIPGVPRTAGVRRSELGWAGSWESGISRVQTALQSLFCLVLVVFFFSLTAVVFWLHLTRQ